MQVNESSENYLETILILSKRNPVVRSVDIAEELGFKKSSVSVAMKNLREKNNITVTKEGYIYLTDSGREIAEMIYERHELLTDWLTRLGVDPKIAASRPGNHGSINVLGSWKMTWNVKKFRKYAKMKKQRKFILTR